MKAYLQSYAPLISVAFFICSSAFFMSYLSLRMQFSGFTGQEIGYVHSAYYAGMLIGAVQIPRLIFYVGHIRVFSAFVACATATVLLIGLLPPPYLWIPLRFISGVSLAAIYVVIESWLLGKSEDGRHGSVLATYMITLYLSQAGAQMILGYVDYYTLEAFLLAGAISVMGVVPVCLFKVQVPQHEVSHDVGKMFDVVRVSPFGFMSCLISGIVLGSIYSFGPNFAEDNQISPSYLMGTTILGGVILQWPIGKLSDIFDRRRVLIGISFSVLVPCMILLLFSDVLPVVLPAVFLLGGVAFTIYPVAVTHVCDRVTTDQIAAVASILLVAYGGGSMIGPLITPYFMDLFGGVGLFVSAAIFSLLLGCVGVLTELYRPSVPKEEQGSFVAVPRTTPIAIDLDPRILSDEEDS